MKKTVFLRIITCFAVTAVLTTTPKQAAAWGPEGHAIVGQLAMKFVTEDVRKNVLGILGTMSIDTAANWMDIMKSNSDYDYMRSWHYLDFPKGQTYTGNNEENIVNMLTATFNELKHKKTLCSDQVRTDLLVLLHLMGDLHMPLHTGYDDDMGGNKKIVQYNNIKDHNLHRFWDEDIIKLTAITSEDCMQLYNSYSGEKPESKGDIDFMMWMNETRGLLNNVYDFPDFTLSQAYLEKNKTVVEKQLLLAGLRLATILNKLFFTPAQTIDMSELAGKVKNGIEAKDALKNIGKNVTVFSRVYGIKASESVTLINLGAKYPKSPLTIVIKSKSYPNFKTLPKEMYNDKNIQAKGTIQEYNGKLEMHIESPDDIIIL